MKKISIFVFLFCICYSLMASYQPKFSTAGFYQLKNTGRTIYSMNVAWRFHKGALEKANEIGFDDRNWPVISLPNGIEYLPTEASGCINYQGEVWYRKHFVPDDKLKGGKLFLHFEAIMGKSKIWVNGILLKDHYGGYLPVIVDVTNYLKWGEDNVIAVLADNSDDPDYPPGKPQDVLDFTYFGGIYRDCWLVAHNHVYITNPNYENEIAGGGLLVAYNKVSEQEADIFLKLQLRNDQKQNFSGTINYVLLQRDGKKAAELTQKIRIKPKEVNSFSSQIKVSTPNLWSPESPYLYNLDIRIRDHYGNIIDGYRQRIGIRSIEFKGENGFWLNGKPYKQPLVGANRHQDFAIVGNALPNSIHWRDAKKLRDAGLKVIRCSHYPQDPAFMDACDELGLFVIVATPGWQYWNKDSIFEKRIYEDICNMVRRDRNHACIFLWEPILNETHYPDTFAKNARTIVDKEFPYPNCYSVCDAWAEGNKYFQILYNYPFPDFGVTSDSSKTYFIREWGDNVDDWNAQNSPSRVNKMWGESPMLIQAKHYAKPDYKYICLDELYRASRQYVGGCLWAAFDTQRGYHPDPFYGGTMNIFRQPKYSYYMFMSQREPLKSNILADTGPMVFIAHEMTPFSGKDVVVYSNCDEVHLTVSATGKEYIYKKPLHREGMPNPTITFKNVYNFMDNVAKSMAGKQDDVFMKADGYIDGKLVATNKVAPAGRPEKLLLWVDNENVNLTADGSDLVTVVAAVADKYGNIKRLNNYFIKFKIEGEGQIIGDEKTMINHRPVSWGTVPVLVQSTTKPGKIKIIASVLFKGKQKPISGELELESIPEEVPLIYDKAELNDVHIKQEESIKKDSESQHTYIKEIETLKKELNNLRLKEVEEQQKEFGEKAKQK